MKFELSKGVKVPRRWIGLVALVSLSSSLYAIELNESLSLNGFGTLGGSYNNDSDFTYRDSVFSQEGSSADFSFATHSKLGLQLSGNINDKFSATAQGVVSKKSPNKLDVDADWANIKYTSESFYDITVGRMRAPIFMYSDVVNVGYANVWAHLPREVYTMVPFVSYNGFEIGANFSLKEHSIVLQALYGNEKDTVASGAGSTDARLSDVYVVSLTDYYGNFKFRGSYYKGKVKLENPQLTQLLNSASQLSQALSIPSIQTAAQQYAVDNVDFRFMGIGVNYQGENLFVSSEYVAIDSDSKIVQGIRTWYLSGGYQLGKWMPYVTYGDSTQDHAHPATDIPVLPVQYGGSTLQDGFSTFAKHFNYNQESLSVGVRYDLYKNMALKAQVDRIYFDSHKRSINFKNNEDISSGHYDVYSIALDFVF